MPTIVQKNATESVRKRGQGPIRTCIGCRESDAPDAMVRLIENAEGGVIVDLGGKSGGRGAWVHARPDCLSKAPRSLGKALRSSVSAKPSELARAIREAADRRVRGLVSGAAGAKRLVFGASAVKQELTAGRVELLMLAKDARAAIESREIEAAIKQGLAVAWGTKVELGELCHRKDLGVVGVLEEGIARALRRAVEWAHMPEPESDFSAKGRASEMTKRVAEEG